MRTRLPTVPSESRSQRPVGAEHRAGVTAFGVRILLRAPRAEMLAQLLVALAPAVSAVDADAFHVELDVVSRPARSSGAASELYAIVQDGTRVACGYNADQITHAVVARIDACVAQNAPNHVFVHAAALCVAGHAVLIPGASFSGKSTLSAALVRRGAVLLSDDYTVLDVGGRVWPYERPASLRPDMALRMPQIAWRWADGAASVALVFDTPFVAGAAWHPQLISRAHGVQALLVHTLSARTAPQRALTALDASLSRAHCYQGIRGEADEAAAFIFAALTGSVRA